MQNIAAVQKKFERLDTNESKTNGHAEEPAKAATEAQSQQAELGGMSTTGLPELETNGTETQTTEE